MAILLSKHATGAVASPVPAGAELVCTTATYTLTADMGTADVIQMMDLPANCVPVDLILTFPALGGSGSVAVGLGDGSTVTTTWLGTTAVATAGSARADAAGLRTMATTVPSATANRPVYIDIIADTTAASGTITLTLFYARAA
jgi:hypothetical protein